MRRMAAVVMITAAMVLALRTPVMAQELMKVTGWVRDSCMIGHFKALDADEGVLVYRHGKGSIRHNISR
jgi:hypothetical protein